MPVGADSSIWGVTYGVPDETATLAGFNSGMVRASPPLVYREKTGRQLNRAVIDAVTCWQSHHVPPGQPR